MPAPVEALAGFLTELAEAGKKVATIQRHAAAIAKAHELAGLDSPTAVKADHQRAGRARQGLTVTLANAVKRGRFQRRQLFLGLDHGV